MSEFREMFPSLLKEYKSSVQSRSYLATLVDSLHLFLRLLEKFTQASSLMVQKKGRAKKKKVLYKRKIRIDEPTREQLEVFVYVYGYTREIELGVKHKVFIVQ